MPVREQNAGKLSSWLRHRDLAANENEGTSIDVPSLPFLASDRNSPQLGFRLYMIPKLVNDRYETFSSFAIWMREKSATRETAQETIYFVAFPANKLPVETSNPSVERER